MRVGETREQQIFSQESMRQAEWPAYTGKSAMKVNFNGMGQSREEMARRGRVMARSTGRRARMVLGQGLISTKEMGPGGEVMKDYPFYRSRVLYVPEMLPAAPAPYTLGEIGQVVPSKPTKAMVIGTHLISAGIGTMVGIALYRSSQRDPSKTWRTVSGIGAGVIALGVLVNTAITLMTVAGTFDKDLA